MAPRRIGVAWLLGIVGILCAGGALLADPDKPPHWTSARLPIDDMPAALRESIRHVVDKPILYSQGPTEEFPCRPALYYWLIDHPDRAIQAWRRLGAQCMEINDWGNGRFGWADGSGSEVHWDTVYRSSALQVWYAEGNVRPGPLLPKVMLQALLVMRHFEAKDESGRPVIIQQADLMLYTDSKTATFATKLLGSSAPRMGEQYVSQLERFFSALACYFYKHPEQARPLLLGEEAGQAEKAKGER